MNCDPLARWYRWMEYLAFGRELERRRECYLPTLGNARQALVLGDGDGRFTAALLRVNPLVRVDYVESSGEMVRLARRRVLAQGSEADLSRVDFQCVDARNWMPGGQRYDLLITHFFLDCFTTDELTPMLERVASVATPDACWIVSEFHQPLRGLAALRAKVWIAGLYRLFGWTTGLHVRRLPDYTDLLEKLGFCRAEAALAEWGLLVSERWRRGGF